MLVLTALFAAIAVSVGSLLTVSVIRAGLTGLEMTNHRGRKVYAVGGIVIVGTVIACEGLLTFLAVIRPGTLDTAHLATSAAAIPRTFLSNEHLGLIVLIFGFFILGLIDDVAGGGQEKGFTGHFHAMRRAELTSGAIKAIGGLFIAFIAAGVWELRIGLTLLDAVLIALSANLINLLDLRPGRAVKVYALAWIPVAGASTASAYLPISAVVTAAALAWLPADLSEKGMLGDAGSNTLGAVLGAGFALALAPLPKLIVLLFLVMLTVMSEKWSFSEAIDRIAPLRWLDGLGRTDGPPAATPPPPS